ncbi:helix-turn-helix domain-containing protein [Oceanobacillus profundus]|uniref:helix-turn-helix domain-containing protein n=1 Tax=Oceanobacillus profundus TaxID=372463 RepID=UPI002559F600|nr:helix-turn-helix transcriptional regulator [Oceanobacillus profundus]
MNEFGSYIKSLRENKGLTLNQVALYSDISAAQLSRIENGKRGVPKPSTIKQIAEALKTDYEELMVIAGYLEKHSNKNTNLDNALTEKDEKDIAKRMKKMKKDLIEGNADGEGLNFMGEPMSEEAIESLVEALEHAERIATLANKKYTPKKFRDKE